ncbi:MAG: zinc ribbon domain-containing protein [Ruminiclostridium sp.]|nr:zinc ribbon domain-containing protein [Ruminiclostridium sp.]
MEKIKCPACGAEMDIGSENCPSCGAPVSAVTEQPSSGTPIDNKEAIDSMLEKANMLVEEAGSLGIEIEEPAPRSESEGQAPAPKGGENAQNNAPNDLAVENDPGVTLFEMDEEGNIIPDPENETDKERKKREKKERRRNRSSDDGGERKKKKASKGAIFIAAVICLVIGAAAGFFGKMFLYPDLPYPECQSFAEKSVKAVYSVLGSGEEIYVAESHVKEFSSSTQCLIRVFFTEGGTVSEKWYRVKVDSAESKKIKVYTQYDEEYLDKLANSDNDEDRAKAAVLSGIQDETDRLVNDMRGGNGWTEANPALLNNYIHPYNVPARENK